MRRIGSNDARLTACVSKRRNTVRGGFTLVEVLAAVVLLSIGLLAVLSAAQAARETQQRAVCMAAGRTVAQSKIEEARATSWASLDGLAGSTSDPSLPAGNTIVVATSQFNNSLGQPDADLKKVTVTVSWPEADGTPRAVVYETVIGNKN